MIVLLSEIFEFNLQPTLGLCEIWEMTDCLLGTEAKFITKSRSLVPLPGRITSAETKAWMCTAADCFNVEIQLHKTFVGCSLFVLSNVVWEFCSKFWEHIF